MKWKADYATGVAEVDRQHKSLFAFTEDFREVLEHGFGEKSYDLFLEFLSTYAEAHFDYEEGCMLAYKCPVADRNRLEHGTFRKMIAAEQAEYAEKGFDRQRAMDLLSRIEQWITSHICRIDVQLRDYAV